MRPYVVSQGDYLTKLAHLMHFDPATVWSDPANSELRSKRPDPDHLLPGDVLYVPTEAPTEHALHLGAANTFVTAPPSVRVCVRYHHHDGTPFDGLEYVVTGAGQEIVGTTSSDGLVDFPVPVLVRKVRVTFPEILAHFDVLVGDLDPITELSGVSQRLYHLGYVDWILAGRTRPPTTPDPACVEAAIREFQHHEKLPVTGTLDAATRARLEEQHGY